MIFFVFYNRNLLEKEKDNDHVVLVKNVKLLDSNLNHQQRQLWLSNTVCIQFFKIIIIRWNRIDILIIRFQDSSSNLNSIR